MIRLPILRVSRERVRQIETRALRKLKRRVRRCGMSLDDIIPRPRHALDFGRSGA